MKIKAVLIDFDGTLVKEDLLDIVCGIVGKQEKSRKINQDFLNGKISGRDSLIKRINLIRGVTVIEIKQTLAEKNYLRPGVKKLFRFLNKKHIVSILNSGNLTVILAYYQQLLNIDYIVGAQPKMKNNAIKSISEEDFLGSNHKFLSIKRILKKEKISPKNILAIGDSMANKRTFKYSAKSVAVSPKDDIKKYADYIIGNDLAKIIDIIKELENE